MFMDYRIFIVLCGTSILAIGFVLGGMRIIIKGSFKSRFNRPAYERGHG